LIRNAELEKLKDR